MRKIYLLIGICCLIVHQAFPQFGEVFASTDSQQLPDILREESYSLKNGLSQL